MPISLKLVERTLAVVFYFLHVVMALILSNIQVGLTVGLIFLIPVSLICFTEQLVEFNTKQKIWLRPDVVFKFFSWMAFILPILIGLMLGAYPFEV